MSDTERKNVPGQPYNWDDVRVGDKVRFEGFITGDHTHWSYTKGEIYTVGTRYKEPYGYITGPIDEDDWAPTRNWDFNFTFVE